MALLCAESGLCATLLQVAHQATAFVFVCTLQEIRMLPARYPYTAVIRCLQVRFGGVDCVTLTFPNININSPIGHYGNFPKYSDLFDLFVSESSCS